MLPTQQLSTTRPLLRSSWPDTPVDADIKSCWGGQIPSWRVKEDLALMTRLCRRCNMMDDRSRPLDSSSHNSPLFSTPLGNALRRVAGSVRGLPPTNWEESRRGFMTNSSINQIHHYYPSEFSVPIWHGQSRI